MHADYADRGRHMLIVDAITSNDPGKFMYMSKAQLKAYTPPSVVALAKRRRAIKQCISFAAFFDTFRVNQST